VTPQVDDDSLHRKKLVVLAACPRRSRCLCALSASKCSAGAGLSEQVEIESGATDQHQTVEDDDDENSPRQCHNRYSLAKGDKSVGGRPGHTLIRISLAGACPVAVTAAPDSREAMICCSPSAPRRSRCC